MELRVLCESGVEGLCVWEGDLNRTLKIGVINSRHPWKHLEKWDDEAWQCLQGSLTCFLSSFLTGNVTLPMLSSPPSSTPLPFGTHTVGRKEFLQPETGRGEALHVNPAPESSRGPAESWGWSLLFSRVFSGVLAVLFTAQGGLCFRL